MQQRITPRALILSPPSLFCTVSDHRFRLSQTGSLGLYWLIYALLVKVLFLSHTTGIMGELIRKRLLVIPFMHVTSPPLPIR